MQNSKLKLNAISLRNTLMATIGLLVIVGVGGFFFFQKYLASVATEVNDSNAKAAATRQDVAQLQRLKTEMADNQVAVTRAASVVGDSKSYQYQDQIINDLSSYAKAAGFSILSFTFADPKGGTSGGSAAPAPATTTASGLKVSTVTVTLPEGLPYATVMTFIKSIEQNLTKMEVNGVTFSVDHVSGKITTQPIVIGVYTR